jgi:ATP phosphoribosyltransferase regulatory subunit
MSKFEEYDLYATNKDFLVSDRVITFTDTDGKLLALKPDVTLSILKNAVEGEKQKVYYNENVYRVSGNTSDFKEIMQSGIECIGEVELYDKYEVIMLAVKSLNLIGGDYLLNLSHLGILTEILSGCDEQFKSHIIKHLSQKNAQGVKNACYNFGREDLAEVLGEISTLYGTIENVTKKLKSLGVSGKAIEELESLNELLCQTEFYDKIRVDLSLTGDMRYYNGLVFKGYISGVSGGILSGGEYGLLAKKMGKNCSAIGFAVYIDLLENYNFQASESDVDTLIIYDEKTDIKTLISTINAITNSGKSVRAQKSVGKIRSKEILDLSGGAK